MILKILKALLKVFHPLALFAAGLFLLAYLVGTYPDKLQYRHIKPFQEETIANWTVIICVILGVFCLLMLILRFLIWVKIVWYPQFYQNLSKEFTSKEKPDSKKTENPAEQEDPVQAEMLNLTAIFKSVSDILRRNWRLSGSGRYSLPWYLVIGPESAGKSNLIRNSGLRFTLTAEIEGALQPFNKSRAQDFLQFNVAGNEAVILEVSGSVISQDPDEKDPFLSALWDTLLKQLHLLRPRQPLNGIIVVLDIAEFAEKNQFERDILAKTIRQHLNDLTAAFNNSVTVHIVFNQIDRLSGFSDFFSLQNNSIRESLAGISVPEKYCETAEWQEYLAHEYAAMADRMATHLHHKLPDLPRAGARQEAFSFVRSIAGLQQPVSAFLETALSADKFSSPPMMRGLYFTSTRQEHQPSNVFLDAISRYFNLSLPVYPVPHLKNIMYFAPQFWKQAVLPEAGMAGVNRKEVKNYRRMSFLVSMMCIGVIAFMSVFWLRKSSEQLQATRRVIEDARTFTKLASNSQIDPSGESYRIPLNLIGTSTQKLGDYRHSGGILDTLSLYKGKVVGPYVDAIYRKHLNETYMPALLKGIEKRLQDVCLRGTNTQLQTLIIYRMLGILEERDIDVIQAYFREFWQKTFTAEASIQNDLANHLHYALTHDPVPYTLDPDLVAQVQSDLGVLSPDYRVYLKMKALAERQLPNPLVFTRQIGTAFSRVYTATPVSDASTPANPADCNDGENSPASADLLEIPRFFTKDAYFNFFQTQLDDVSQIAANDLRALGLLEKTEYSQADYDSIKDKLRQTYVDRYIKIWRQALTQTKVKAFESLRDSVEITRIMSQSDSPLRRLAEITRQETILYEPKSVPLLKNPVSTADLPFDANRESGLRINREFDDIRQMLDTEEEGTRPNIEEIQNALASLHEYLKSIQDAPEPTAHALHLAKNRVLLIGDDPIYTLRQIAQRTPAPFNSHLEHIADESWRIILQNVAQELDRLWREEVYAYYSERLEGRYPVYRNTSAPDVALSDFTDFFKPEGILHGFYEDKLAIFVDKSTGLPQSIDGQSLDIDIAFTNNLKKALDATSVFFSQGNELKISYVVTPLGMNTSLSRSVLNFEGQIVINSHRATRGVRIVWPNLLGAPEMSRYDLFPISKETGSTNRQFDGPWSWLRLYDHAGKSGISGNTVDMLINDSQGRQALYRYSVQGTVNPFFNSPFDGFALPKTIARSVSKVTQ